MCYHRWLQLWQRRGGSRMHTLFAGAGACDIAWQEDLFA
jgi:hypothetical protein